MIGADHRVPSMWMRVFGIIGAGFMVLYGALGVLRNDLHVSLSKSSSSGVHLHGFLAWLCFAGMMMMSIGLVRLLAPDAGASEFDFDARRHRFGPLFLSGLVLFGVAQLIADLRS